MRRGCDATFSIPKDRRYLVIVVEERNHIVDRSAFLFNTSEWDFLSWFQFTIFMWLVLTAHYIMIMKIHDNPSSHLFLFSNFRLALRVWMWNSIQRLSVRINWFFHFEGNQSIIRCVVSILCDWQQNVSFYWIDRYSFFSVLFCLYLCFVTLWVLAWLRSCQVRPLGVNLFRCATFIRIHVCFDTTWPHWIQTVCYV